MIQSFDFRKHYIIIEMQYLIYCSLEEKREEDKGRSIGAGFCCGYRGKDKRERGDLPTFLDGGSGNSLFVLRRQVKFY